VEVLTMSTTEDNVREILAKTFPDKDLSSEDNLVTSGEIDSMSAIMLVGELEDEFGISISPLDMIPENFASATTIAALVDRLEQD
jgi:acyl carrier protein